MPQREVVHIQGGLDQTGEIVLQFQHNDASSYSTKFSRAVCVKLIGLLEQLHGQAMAQAQAAGLPQDKLGVQDQAQIRLYEGDEA